MIIRILNLKKRRAAYNSSIAAIVFGDMDDIPEIVASTQHNAASPNPWNTLDDEKKKGLKIEGIG